MYFIPRNKPTRFLFRSIVEETSILQTFVAQAQVKKTFVEQNLVEIKQTLVIQTFLKKTLLEPNFFEHAFSRQTLVGRNTS